MGKINPTLNTNLILGWEITDWASVEAAASAPLTDSQGMNYNTSVTLTPYQSESDWISIQASALFGDSRYLNTWYGVSEKQSANSGKRRYNTSAGFYGTDLGLTWSHQLNSNWSTNLTYNYSWLSGCVSKGPIVRKREGSIAAVGVGYTF